LGLLIHGVVGNALFVSLLAEEGWDSVDVVREAGSSAVAAGTVDDERVRVTVILQKLATEFRACGLLSSAPLALHAE